MVNCQQPQSFYTHQNFQLVPTYDLVVVEKQKLQVFQRIELVRSWKEMDAVIRNIEFDEVFQVANIR